MVESGSHFVFGREDKNGLMQRLSHPEFFFTSFCEEQGFRQEVMYTFIMYFSTPYCPVQSSHCHSLEALHVLLTKTYFIFHNFRDLERLNHSATAIWFITHSNDKD